MKTAVEWLVETITKKHDKHFSTFYGAEIEQAKQMEKEQIMHAYGQGAADEAGEILDATKDSEEYYNKKYGGEK